MSNSSPWVDNSLALKTIVETHEAALRRFFTRRVRSTSEVDDLVQDVFLCLVRRGALSDITHVQAYIFQTANNVLREHLRRNRYRQGFAAGELEKDELTDEEPSAERLLIGKESICQFAIALFELPERTRVIFISSRLKGLDYKTIAKLQGISISAVEKHMAKALVHLVWRLKD